MMLDTIREALEQARKNREREKVMWLGTLLSKCLSKAKDKGNSEPTDAEVFDAVTKSISAVDETLRYTTSETARAQSLAERAVFEQFLPQPLTRDELTAEVDKLVGALPVRDMKQMGGVMNALRTNFAGRFDGTTASALVRQRLA